jgi:PAS domain S-box-containing protein
VRWAWLERSVLARYAFGAAVTLLAVAGQWLMFPFLLFLPAIIFVTVLAGRGPGYLVFAAGAINATLQLAPMGAVQVVDSADRIALFAYSLTGLFLVYVGHRLRMSARREYSDLEALHELSTTLVSIADVREQLRIILQTLAGMHGTDQGLISLCDRTSNTLRVVASLRFSAEALQRLETVKGDEGASAIACLEGRRVVVEDANQAASFAGFRELAAQEGFNAVHSTPIKNQGGEILGVISLHFPDRRRPTRREIRLADICAAKAAVAIQRATAEDLANQREEQFRTVLEASAVPFSILEPVRDDSGRISDFRWQYVNAAAARIIGRPRKHLVGRTVGEVLPGHWDHQGLLEMYASVVNEQKPAEQELRRETDGGTGWFQIVASPLSDRVGVWFADITERKQQEEALKAADRRKDEFLATLAHELRNPLAPIRQAAAIIDNDRADRSQRRWGHSIIDRQVQRMSLLLDDLLDVSRITRGTLSLRKEVLRLRDVIAAAVETARPLIEGRRHKFVSEVSGQQRINGDPLRLSQIFSNLLTNAARYTPPGGLIRLSAHEEQGTLIVQVQDTGIGLREEELPRLFQMFTQGTSSPEHITGLGIGLALTKGLVELHGGTIEGRSAGPGRGSVFVVRLPVGEVEQADSAPRADKRESHLVISRRVLIADDNPDSAESLAMLLRLEGHQVVVGHDGATAVRLFEAHAPEIALLDIGMPQLDGYEVARRIRANPAGRDVFLIALTGWGQEKDRLSSREAGFDHHLVKPVDPTLVLRLVQLSSRSPAATG